MRKTRVYSGGIVLLYTNTTCGDSCGSTTEQNVLIENFEIFNINSINQITWNVHRDTVYDSTVTYAAALGVIFNQHNFSVKIVITHAYMSNITSKTGPIVYASYNSSNASNSITISNTVISNNNNEEQYPNIKIIIGLCLVTHYNKHILNYITVSFPSTTPNQITLLSCMIMS